MPRASRFLIISVALCVMGSASAAGSSPRLGIADIHTDGTACVMFRGDPVKSGTPVVVVLFQPPRVVDGVVLQKAPKPCNQVDSGETSYAVKLRYGMGDLPEVGIAIDSPGARVNYEAGEFLVYTKGATTPLTFRECTSTEGVHLTAWRGGRRTWHDYWYLGYDVEASCTDEETAEKGAP